MRLMRTRGRASRVTYMLALGVFAAVIACLVLFGQADASEASTDCS